MRKRGKSERGKKWKEDERRRKRGYRKERVSGNKDRYVPDQLGLPVDLD